MLRYLGRRLLQGFFLLAAVSVLAFLLLDLAPGNFFDQMRLNTQIRPETVSALRARYGLDRSLPVRYGRWMESVLQGDLGFSFAFNGPVAPLLWPRALHTLLLTATATLLAWLVAIPLGVWAASAKGKWPDRLCGVASSSLLVIPDLLLALGLLFLALRTGLFPVGGMHSLGSDGLSAWGRFKDLAAHLFLPACALVLGALPMLLQHVRAAMLEVMASPCIRAARGHGIPRLRLLFRHALPVAANPLISLFGFSVATLFSVSLLVEVVMSWPGLGPFLLEAIQARDFHVVIGAVMLSTILLVIGNLLADLLLYAADPRIRTE